MVHPLRLLPLLALCFAVGVSADASGASVECTSKPSDPGGYQVAAVHGDKIVVPASATAIAVLHSGVAAVPELQRRLHQGCTVATGDQNTNDTDGYGTLVASVAAAAAVGVRGVSPTSPIVPVKIF